MGDDISVHLPAFPMTLDPLLPDVAAFFLDEFPSAAFSALDRRRRS
jgi:hypothetical protein